jgi:hypothetical protein
VAAQFGVDVVIAADIYGREKGGHEKEKPLRQPGGRGGRSRSGVSFGEEMDNTVNIRSVADVAKFHFKIEQLGDIIHFHRKRRTVRQMVDQGLHFAEVYWPGEYFSHHCLCVEFAAELRGRRRLDPLLLLRDYSCFSQKSKDC